MILSGEAWDKPYCTRFSLELGWFTAAVSGGLSPQIAKLTPGDQAPVANARANMGKLGEKFKAWLDFFNWPFYGIKLLATVIKCLWSRCCVRKPSQLRFWSGFTAVKRFHVLVAPFSLNELNWSCSSFTPSRRRQWQEV
jgi:hypothetical protein